MATRATEAPDVSGVLAEVAVAAGQEVSACVQCKRCTSGCPLADATDLVPHRLMRALQLGQVRRALDSATIWLCAGCQTCTTRCPEGIDLAAVMDALRVAATRRGIRPRVPEAAIFARAAVGSIRRFGRLYEAGVALAVNLGTGRPLRDAPLAWQMWRAGRLRLLPQVAPGRTGRRAAPRAIGYYPGCSLHCGARDYDRSARAVAGRLGLFFQEIDGWRCCGASAAHQADPQLALAWPRENLALAAEQGYETVTAPCAACFSRLRHAQVTREHPPGGARDPAGPGEPETAAPPVRVEHLLDTLLGAGREAVAAGVVRPLKNLKVACYYGCLLTRPPAVTGADHPENPTGMEKLLTWLGAEPVAWSYKTECCGASHAVVRPDLAVRLTGRILEDAWACGADAVAVACPLCHTNLDARQDQTLPGGNHRSLPVFFFTQLVALAFGLGEAEIGLEALLTDPFALLRARGFV